jgi:5-methyltetrahydrofolate--homocysteine methyltransferase
VAKEMTRQGFELPLLIGGATTSKAHTAVKIAPAYRHATVHVLDASRAVGVVGSLISKEQREIFTEKVRADYERVRQAHQDRGPKILRGIETARKNRLSTDWAAADIPTPSFTGLRTIDRLPLRELVPYIDWSPFFHTWELRGRYPSIFNDATVGPKAKELFEDAQALLAQIINGELLTARGVYGFFPANSVGDDIEIYRDQERRDVQARFHTLRQQTEKPADQFNLALADFIAPQESRRTDYLGAFAVTAGIGVEALCAKYEKDHDDYNSIMTKALADRLAEAFAEWLHKQVRLEWGYGKAEELTTEDLIRERYRGIRPAPGYPACPDHTEKRTLFDLLDAEAASGVTLTESFAMLPAASVSGLYFAHPQAKYFAVGKINRDQVEDYAIRKKLPVSEIERWLAPNLNYDA